VASLGFSALSSFYAANFTNFNKTHGSLGAVMQPSASASR
jgi:uncharacterized BrkB/YihY/UPF0761 family membrane protein